MASISDLINKLTGKKKTFSNQEKPKSDPVVVLSAGVVVALVVVVVLVVFIIYPSVNSILSVREEITKNEELLEKLETKKSVLEKADRDYKANQASFEKLNLSVPNDAEYVEDLKILEKIAADTTDSGANFVMLQTSLGQLPIYQEPTKTAQQYEREIMTFSISFKADYAGTQEFLERIKQNLRNFSVKQLVFSAASGSRSNLLDVTVTVESIYYLPY